MTTSALQLTLSLVMPREEKSMPGKPNDGPSIMVSTLFDGLGKEKKHLGKEDLGPKNVLLMPCKMLVSGSISTGAMGYLNTYSINSDDGLANGTEIKYHSLSFEDKEQRKQFRLKCAQAKPGDIITLTLRQQLSMLNCFQILLGFRLPKRRRRNGRGRSGFVVAKGVSQGWTCCHSYLSQRWWKDPE